jgi:hypothetical protein
MRDALFLIVAFAATCLGFVGFALAQPQHWRAVTDAGDCSRSGRQSLKIAGVGGLVTGLSIVLWREGPDYGALLWVAQLPIAALCVVATLSVKPRLLKLLAAIAARA